MRGLEECFSVLTSMCKNTKEVSVRELIDYLLLSNLLSSFSFSTKDDIDFGALAAEIEGAGAAKEQEPQKSKGKKKKEKKKQDFEYVLKSRIFLYLGYWSHLMIPVLQNIFYSFSSENDILRELEELSLEAQGIRADREAAPVKVKDVTIRASCSGFSS